MSSTSPDASATLGALFDAVIAPESARCLAACEAPFPSKPDPAVESYYVNRAQAAMTREDFTAPSCEGFDDFERRLAAHWTRLGRGALAAAAPRFADAAREAYALADESAEVSPFVYVMF